MARRLVLALGSSAFVAAAVLACSSDSFDDLQLDAGYRFLPDATSDQDTPVDGGFHPDGAPIDPTEGEVDGGDGGNDPTTGCTTCDCDKDGYDRPNCGDGQGKDCNDNDPRVHPGASFSTTVPTAGFNGDWNCDGKVETLYATKVSCADHAVSLGNCSQYTGFSADVGCGQRSEFVGCAAPVLGILFCSAQPAVQVTQGCR